MPERKTLNEDLFYRGSSANLPRLHTCENKVPFWDFSQFAVTKISKGLFKGLPWRGCWRPNINFIFWPHCYDRHVVSFLFSWCWGPLHRGFPRTPSVGCGFPYHISSLTLWRSASNCFGTQTQPNYIIIQRPHDRPVDLWNRMFNRHQAEITVMQFRGYSLPVHHCSGTMGPSPCPIS